MRKTCSISDCRPRDALAFCPVHGDILGNIISLGTLPWSLRRRFCHFALVAPRNGILCVYESTVDPGLGPCFSARVHVNGVQCHRLVERLELHLGIRRGRVFRLPLSERAGGAIWRDYPKERNAIMAFDVACSSLLGTGYDARQAWGSRTLLGGAAFRAYDRLRRRRAPSTNDRDFLFCSEFALVVYQKLGLLPYHSRGRPINLAIHPKAAARLLEDCGICGQPEEILP